MTVMLGTCAACARHNQQVERVVKARMEMLICVDAKVCMSRWNKGR